MKTVALLQSLSCQGIEFWLDNGQLRSGGSSDILTPEIVSELRQNKAEIVRLLEQDSDVFCASPLSQGQKALWFLWQLEPESCAYHQVVSVRICDQFDPLKMRAACDQLLQRHSCLRSIFPRVGEDPIRQIEQCFDLDWQEIDASNLSEAETKITVVSEAQKPFDLQREIATRFRVFSSSPQEHILLIAIHHIVTDGWSLDIILSELAELYQAQVH
ncbi:MAG: condensation domain-containing protein, partial [Cyanobacteria bacterium J06555_13]